MRRMLIAVIVSGSMATPLDGASARASGPDGEKENPVVLVVRPDDKDDKKSATMAVGATLQVKLPFVSNGYLWELVGESNPKALPRCGAPELKPGKADPEFPIECQYMVFEFRGASPDPDVRLRFEYVRRYGKKRSEPARTVFAVIKIQ